MSQPIPILGNLAPETPKLLPLSVKEFSGEPPKYPPVVIEGLLRQKEMLLMGGQAKKWKSWARADMLYCIGNGFRWLKFPTHQGMVVHFDLELLEADLRWRFEQIHQSYSQEGFKGSLDNLRYVTLRGVPFIMSDLEAHAEQLKAPHYIMASVDPIYRLLGAKSESDPAAVCDLLTRFLNLGSTIDASIALLQHFTKGDQSQKESQDRFSGTGIWNRFPDSLITFTDLEDQNCCSCEFTLRSFQPIEPFAVRWQFPRFRIDEKLDPQNIKTKTVKRTPKFSVELICDVLNPDESISWTDWFKKCRKLFGIGETSFRYKVNYAKEHKFVFLNTDNRYELTHQYIEKNGQ